MEDPSTDKLDALLRERPGVDIGVPADFRIRVWRAIRARESEPTFSDWLMGTILAPVSSVRLLASCSIMAVLFSGALGVWLGYATLAVEDVPGIFPALESDPGLAIFE